MYDNVPDHFPDDWSGKKIKIDYENNRLHSNGSGNIHFGSFDIEFKADSMEEAKSLLTGIIL